MSRAARLPAGRGPAYALAALPVAGLLLCFAYPLAVIGAHSFADADGAFSLGNYARLWREPGLLRAAWHSLLMSGAVTLVAVVLGFAVAFALHRSRMPGKRLLRAALLLPLLTPSLMQGLGLTFLLGRNGLVHRWAGLDTDIYGFAGLLAANSLYVLPQAVAILSAALARADRRYYDTAETMGAPPWRQFVDVTLPQARFGLLSAAFVAFTLSFTDFGNAIVVGGSYRVLATEIYDQVSGQMDFGMGAAIGLVLLLPSLLSLGFERAAARAQAGDGPLLPIEPPRNRLRDAMLSLPAAAVLLSLAAVSACVVFASVARLWPYHLAPTLAHYRSGLADGYTLILTSLEVSAATAALGTALLFALALAARRLPVPMARFAYLAATLPAAVPGMVLGIAYAMAFNTGPLSSWLYGSLAILVLCNLYHHHAQGFLAMSTGLRGLPAALEDAVASLGGHAGHALRDVVLPFAAPTLASVFFLLFTQSMVTLSAVVFLVTPTLGLASVAVMQLEENGFVSQAAAYSTCILAVTATALALVRLLAARAGAHRQRQGRTYVA